MYEVIPNCHNRVFRENHTNISTPLTDPIWTEKHIERYNKSENVL